MHDGYDYELSEPDTSLLEDESPDIRNEIIQTLGEEWLHTKNILLNNRMPAELIGTPDEIHLRDIMRSFLISALS